MGARPGGSATPSSTPSPRPSRRPSRRTVVACAGALVAVVLAVAVALGAREAPPEAAVPTPPPAASPTPGPSASPSPAATPSATPTPSPEPSAAALPTGDPPAPAEDIPLPPGLEVVEPGVVPELPPVSLDEPADFGTEVTARLVEVRRVEGQGRGLGEESGPALAVTVEMRNGTDAPVDLDYVVVNLADQRGDPGQTLFGDPRSEPFGGPLPPGETRTGTYVLRLPSPDSLEVSVTVSYGAQAPTAVFAGPVPRSGTTG